MKPSRKSNSSTLMHYSVRHGNIDKVLDLIKKYGISPCFEEWSDGYDLLVEALKYRHSAIAKLLISKGAKVNLGNSVSSSVTPLHVAVQNNDKEIIEMLLERGVLISATGGDRKSTPLYEAVYSNKKEIAELLLTNGAEVDLPNHEDETPLWIAVQRGLLDIVKMLVRHGANVNCLGEHSKLPKFTLLHVAAMKGYKDIVLLLLSSGAVVNAATPDLRTPLHVAVESQMTDIVETLLSCDASVNAETVNAVTPLHIAVEKNSKEIVQLLLDAGACVNAATTHSVAPLHIAVQHDNRKIVELLLSRDASVIATTDSYTPLHMAVKNRSENIIDLLLDKGADVNTKAADSHAPLHDALILNLSNEIVKLLLSRGANVDAGIEDSLTPLHIAVDTGRIQIVEWILDSGANINAKTVKSKTPLHIAIENNSQKLVKCLLDRGADVNAEDVHGDTALCLSVLDEHSSLFPLVLSHHPDVSNRNNQNALSIAIRREGEKDEIIRDLLVFGFPVMREDARLVMACVIKNGLVNVAEDICKHGPDSRLDFNMTPLHLAAMHKQIEIVKVLLNFGADIDAKDTGGRTPIHFAVANADVEMFDLFLVNRANVNNNPELLHLAVQNGTLEMVKSLLEHGCDVNYVDADGRNALHNANFSRKPGGFRTKNPRSYFPGYLIPSSLDIYSVKIRKAIIELLLGEGADVNSRDKNYETPLHIAAREGLSELVEMFLNSRADVNSADRFGNTALDIAVSKKNFNLTKILLTRGAKINNKSKSHENVLHIASRQCEADMVKLLLDNHADVNAMSEDGTALHIAVKKRRRENIIILLLECGADVNAICKYGTALHLACRFRKLDILQILLHYGSNINIKSGSCNMYSDGHLPVELAERHDNDLAIGASGKWCPDKYKWCFLCTHIVKMKAVGLTVSKENLDYLKQKKTAHRLQLQEFLLECENELDLLKSMKIGDSNFSFYDIVAGSSRQVTALAGNENFAKILSSWVYKMTFPHYADMIKSKFEMGKRRREFEEKSRLFFSGGILDLPDVCVDIILSYLTNADLRMLIFAHFSD